MLITVEDVTTVDPAIIELEDGVEYTFKIIDADHPDGVLITRTAELDMKADRGIMWIGADSNCFYTITYKDGTNTISSEDVQELNPNYPVSFYQPGAVHNIDNKYIDAIAPVIVHFTRISNTWSADMTCEEIYQAATQKRPIIGLYDSESKFSGCSQYVLSNVSFNDRTWSYDASFYRMLGSSCYTLSGSGSTWTMTQYNFTVK